MSKESVQFVEMVREAAGRRNPQMGADNSHGITRKDTEGLATDGHGGIQKGTEAKVGLGVYCEVCGAMGMDFVRDEGKDEIYRCPFCGWMRWFRVR